MSKLTTRPAIVDRYIEVDKREKRCAAKKKALRQRLSEVLRFADFKDIRLIEVKKPFVNEKLAIKWLRKQRRAGLIDKDTYNSMFVRLFNPNAFISLIRSKRVLRKALPKNIYGTAVSEQIKVFQPKAK